MSLQAGDTLGPYAIETPIGVGGMGEVYRATDRRLGRLVAIKVLPAQVAADPEWKRRFAREAQTISSLSHPHICTLYEFDSVDNVDFLVLELIEGETLADRLARGSLPIETAVRHGIQIADALGAAHRHGVIHRDLKPGNVMITKAGAKLLDFGLAKIEAPMLRPSARTRSESLTAPGMLIGTLHYMAPEQIDGGPADVRTDIWALGALIFEMVTGHKAFDGPTPATVMRAILESDPGPVSARQPAVSGELDYLVATCLAKDPEDRWQSARDLMRQLARLPSTRHSAAPTPSRPGRASGVLILATVLSLLAGAVVGFSCRAAPDGPQMQPVRRGSLLHTGPGRPEFPSLDAAGRTLVFEAPGVGGVNQLWVHRLDEGSSSPLQGTEGVVGHDAAVSPDGSWVAFVSNQQLKKVAIQGGDPVSLAPMLDAPIGLAWDGVDQVIFGGASGLSRVAAAGGEVASISTVDPSAGEVDHRLPSVTHDRAILAYTVWAGSSDSARIRVRSLRSGLERTVAPGSSPRVTPTGHLVFVRGQSLWAARIDAGSLELQSDPVPVLDGVISLNNGYGDFDISHDGTLVYNPRLDRAVPLALVDSAGRVTGLLGEGFRGLHHGPPRFSPDGAAVVVGRHPVGGDDHLVIHDVRRGTITPLMPGAVTRFPAWAPDGRRLAFASTRNGTWDLFQITVPEASDPVPLLVREGDQWPRSWSPDGQVLAFDDRHRRGDWDVWVLPLDGEPRVLLGSPASESDAAFSPDGRALAFVSNESGRPEVYVQGYPEGSKARVSLLGGTTPVWAPRGEGIYYETLEGDVHYARVSIGSAVSVDAPELVFTGPLEALAREGGFDVAPDGETFVTLRDAQTTAALALVINWHQELEARVPPAAR